MALRIVEQAGLTDVGRQREANEDTFVIDEPLFAVADGMGGAQAGEVASKMAKEVLEAGDEAGTPEERLIRMIRNANQRIYKHAASEESRRGMGTTTTAALLEGRTVTVGHVGDSRAYRLRDGSLEQLTRDDSYVQLLVDEGHITQEAAGSHPQRNLVLQALTGEAVMEPAMTVREARAGDRFMLCSDGLSDVVDKATLAAALSEGEPEASVQRLIELALANRTRDNVTAIVADVIEVE